MADCIEDIRTIVVWYREKSTTASLIGIMKMADKLSCDLFDFAEIVGDFGSDYEISETDRRIGVAKSAMVLINNKTAISRANIESLTLNEDKFRKESQEKAAAKQASILYWSANTVLKTMQQRISYLKKQEELKLLTQ